MARFENSDEPEVLAVVALPSAAERSRRERVLARLMLVMVDIVLAGDPLLGVGTARDLLVSFGMPTQRFWTTASNHNYGVPSIGVLVLRFALIIPSLR